MTLSNSLAVTREGKASLPREEDERRRYNNINKGNNEQDGEPNYIEYLRSRFGEDFLPFALQLESVEKNQTK